jgi:AcrR family transcriptional regulator
MAMTRYYYGNKLGLFEAVFVELTTQMHQRLAIIEQSHQAHRAFGRVIEFYDQFMGDRPGLPKQLYLLLEVSAHSPQTPVVLEYILPMFERLQRLFTSAAQGSAFTPHMRMAFVCSMVFPFLMPTVMHEHLQLELTPKFFRELAIKYQYLLNEAF